MDDFSDYDEGLRHGIFDKCNRRPCKVARSDDPSLWDAGYLDGWDANEVKIGEPEELEVEFEPEERFFSLWCEWDYGQGEKIFDSEQRAFEWLDEQQLAIDDGAEGAMSAQEMFDEGLAGIDIVTLIR